MEDIIDPTPSVSDNINEEWKLFLSKFASKFSLFTYTTNLNIVDNSLDGINMENVKKTFNSKMLKLQQNTCRKKTEIEYKKYTDLFKEVVLLSFGHDIPNPNFPDTIEIKELLIKLPRLGEIYRHIIDTRRYSFGGKGERELAIRMVMQLANYYPTLSIYIIHDFVLRKIGCWNDARRICELIFIDNGNSTIYQNKLAKECIALMCNTLYNEYIRIEQFLNNSSTNSHNINTKTNVAKWFPRESGKYGWLFSKCLLYWKKHNNKYITKKKLRKIIITCNTYCLSTKKEIKCLSTYTPTNIHPTTIIIPQFSYNPYKHNIQPSLPFFPLNTINEIKTYFEMVCYPWATNIPQILKKYLTGLPNIPYPPNIINALDNWILSIKTHTLFSPIKKYILPVIDLSMYNNNEHDHFYYKSLTVGLSIMIQNKEKRILLIHKIPQWIQFDNNSKIPIYEQLKRHINKINNFEYPILPITQFERHYTSLIISDAFHIIAEAMHHSNINGLQLNPPQFTENLYEDFNTQFEHFNNINNANNSTPTHPTPNTTTNNNNTIILVISPFEYIQNNSYIVNDMYDEIIIINDELTELFKRWRLIMPKIIYWNMSSNFRAFGIDNIVS